MISDGCQHTFAERGKDPSRHELQTYSQSQLSKMERLLLRQCDGPVDPKRGWRGCNKLVSGT